MVWLLILEEPNQSSMEIMLHSTASLKDDMKKWYSNGSPAKVWYPHLVQTVAIKKETKKTVTSIVM